MKDNWQKKPLGELVSTQKGKISEQSTFPLEGFAPIINTDVLRGDIKVWGKVLGSVNCIKNDVLILWDGERSGLCATGYEGVVGSTFAKMSVSNELDSNFLYRFVDFNFDWIQGQRTGTGVPHVPKNLNTILTVNYPPLPQQKKIAKILSTCDAVIEKTEAAIAKYKDIKQGMMHDLFTRGIDLSTGKLRPTPEQAPDLYEDSELGKIPKDWRVDVFENLCPKVADRDHFTPTYFDTGVPIISPKDFDENHNISFEKCKFISNEAHLKNCKKTDLRTDDLVFTRIGAGLGKVAIVESWMPEFSILHSSCMIRTFERALNSKYLMYFIKGELLQKQISIEVQSIGVPDLGLDKIRLFKCLHPVNLKEQELISKRLSTIDDKIFIEQSTKAKFEKIKSGLMQDLLTGKVEVKVELEETA